MKKINSIGSIIAAIAIMALMPFYASGQTLTIAVPNGDFESGPGYANWTKDSDWISVENSSKMTPTEGHGSYYTQFNCLNGNSNTQGTFHQTLSATYAAGSYVLSFDYGAPYAQSWASGLYAQLLNGGTVLASTTALTPNASLPWTANSVSLDIPADSSLIGQPITIKFQHTGLSDCAIDNVALSFIPQPSSGSYATWAAAQTPPLLGEPTAVGNDGVTNLIVYAIAGLKTDGTNGAVGTLTGPLLSFTKRAEAVANGDVTYAIEESDDLGQTDPWAEVASYQQNDATTISCHLPSGKSRSFARLVVRQP